MVGKKRENYKIYIKKPKYKQKGSRYKLSKLQQPNCYWKQLQNLSSKAMIEQDLIVEDEGQSLGVQGVDMKIQKKDGRRDFNVVKLQRISKLQQILTKNLKLREGSVSNKQKPQYPFIERIKPTYKRSLPQIRHSGEYRHQISNDQIQNNNGHFAQENDNVNSLLKKYRQKLALNNHGTRALINFEQESKILEENPQTEEKQQEQKKSILKLKVRNLQLQEVKKDSENHPIKKLRSSISKSSIWVSKSSMERASSIQRLIMNANKQQQKQKQQTKDIRRKRRNASTLNLTKIQHLPQIVFPIHKKCTKSKFPSMSMAQIDHNLLTNEIFELEEKRVIQARNREKRERALKEKIKTHNKSHFLMAICQ